MHMDDTFFIEDIFVWKEFESGGRFISLRTRRCQLILLSMMSAELLVVDALTPDLLDDI